jgi:capsid protein
MLELWVWGLWTTGEYFVHLTSDESVKQGISLRLQNIASSRIATPWGSFGHDNIIMGIKRLPNGRPISYSVQNGDLNELGLSKVEFEEVPADKMIHGFRTREAGQARGIPWLNSSLPAIADMRDYDEQVLDAARAAADYAVFMQTTSPDIEAVAMNESTDIERRTLSTLPPGYVLSEAKANQPSTKYIEFRRERQADIGKPVGMPEMMVRLDSSGHNYSSARFDGQLYRAGIDKQRARIEEKALNIFVDLVATEARVADLLPPVPVDMELLWTWPAAPHVDPKKEADAERIQLESGTLTYTKALSSKGMDLDTTIETRKIETEKLAKAGLPPVPTADGSSDTSDDDDDDDDATNTNTGSEEDEDDEGMFG